MGSLQTSIRQISTKLLIIATHQKKCYFELLSNLNFFIHNGASGRVAEVGQSGSVGENFFGEVANTAHHSSAQRKISIIRFYI